ncbi:MAG: GntR family transcriptional regulator, partial [Variovorax sp.]
MLTRTSTQSLTGQLADRLAERIRTRLLPPGARLPSVRECARQQGVSPYTVVAAYDQLLAQGLVEARRQRGFYVRDSAPAQEGRPPNPAAAAPMVMQMMASRIPADASSLIRSMFHRPSDKPQPGMGVFPPDWMASTFMPTAVRRMTSTAALQELSLQYGEPAGDMSLRRSLSQKLVGINVPASPDQIVTTIGATHALDIVSRTLLRAGDPVMVEEPGWALEFARLEALGMRILP